MSCVVMVVYLVDSWLKKSELCGCGDAGWDGGIKEEIKWRSIDV